MAELAGPVIKVVIALGSHISPSMMVEKASRKELEAAELINKVAKFVSHADWEVYEDLVATTGQWKRDALQTSWSAVLKDPFTVTLTAHKYLGAARDLVVESRRISARALKEQSRLSQSTNLSSVPGGHHAGIAPAGPGTIGAPQGLRPHEMTATQQGRDLIVHFDGLKLVVERPTKLTLQYDGCGVTVHFEHPGSGDSVGLQNGLRKTSPARGTSKKRSRPRRPAVKRQSESPLMLSGTAELVPATPEQVDPEAQHYTSGVSAVIEGAPKGLAVRFSTMELKAIAPSDDRIDMEDHVDQDHSGSENDSVEDSGEEDGGEDDDASFVSAVSGEDDQ